MKRIQIALFVIVSLSTLSRSDVLPVNVPINSASSTINSASSASQAEAIAYEMVVNKLFGFPFDLEGVDEKNARLLRGYSNSNYSGLKSKLVKLYKSGGLENKNRKDTVRKIFKKAIQEGKYPIEGMTDLNAFHTDNPSLDVEEIVAGFIVAGKFAEFEDIVPFLEFSQVFYGDDLAAFGHRIMIVSLSQLELDPDQPLAPEQRLNFWPAANAILKNPDASLPLLMEAVQRRDLREDLRLRAVSFINTINGELINEDLLKNCEGSFRAKAYCIKEKNIKWRHPVYNVCKEKTEKDRQKDEMLLKKLNLDKNTDVKALREEMDRYRWGKY